MSDFISLFPNRWTMFIEAETVEGVKDNWVTHTPTGRRRAAVVFPLPVWLVQRLADVVLWFRRVRKAHS